LSFSLALVGSFVGSYTDVPILLDFLYLFVKFCLEVICCSIVGFKLYSLDHIKHVVFKFIEITYVWWWVFLFESVGFFIVANGVVLQKEGYPTHSVY